MMRRVGGYAVVLWLRGKPEFDRVPVVMLSGDVHEANRVRAKELGVKSYVEKPQDFPELMDLISEWQKLYLNNAPES